MPELNRRSFLWTAASGCSLAAPATGQIMQGTVHAASEWIFTSGKHYEDPFNQTDLDLLVSGPGASQARVPAFWSGGQEWRARFAPPRAGRYTWRTACSDPSNGDLHGRTGSFPVESQADNQTDNNVLTQHGPIRVAPDRRHFEHSDGTPFFWLADTWWMGFCKRLRWPDDFQLLTADRVRKGFTAVQIVAGLYPDMPQFDSRGANEAGYPWEPNYSRINPAYFDMADLRVRWLAQNGLVPCVVGCWGYYLPILGIPRIKKHWRYLVARWGAYPVVWCLAGEGSMPYYLSKNRAEDAAAQKSGWTEMARYVRGIDPAHHPITIHPTMAARDNVDDPSVLDFDMLQTGHGDRESIPGTLEAITKAYARAPHMPVIDGEVCYEGIQEASRQEIQRFMFWACMLSGAAGHTYGANGIWQVNNPGVPFGASPHGRSWGNTPWQTAYQLPGSGQIGMGKALLEKYRWWKMEPHPEWFDPHWSSKDYWQAYTAGKLRISFLPRTRSVPFRMKNLEADVRYRAFFFNPASGERTELGGVQTDASGDWIIPAPPIFQDYVLVMEKAS
ncbi:MAG: DUF4038 domain-containing protein [Acidobacteriota bacterium]|nr:DUF4038 domain-containing protein [Acidobacteriota bacterium]